MIRFALSLVLPVYFWPTKFLCYASTESALQALRSIPNDYDAKVASTTISFKQDVVAWCSTVDCERLTILDVGLGMGHTTALLSHLFHQVIAVDYEGLALERARRMVADHGRRNVVFFQVDVYRDGWQSLVENQVDVIFIDANHDLEYIRSDTMQALMFPNVSWIIFHDYDYGSSVQVVVNRFRRSGYLSCDFIGDKNRARLYGPSDDPLVGPEGALCTVLQPLQPLSLSDFMLGQNNTFFVFRSLKDDDLGSDPFESCRLSSGRIESATALRIHCSCMNDMCRRTYSPPQREFRGLAKLTREQYPDGRIHVGMVWEWKHNERPWSVHFTQGLSAAFVKTDKGGRHGGRACVLVRRAAVAAVASRQILLYNRGLWYPWMQGVDCKLLPDASPCQSTNRNIWRKGGAL
eukprot:TRINITY_DN27388_c0_g2_i1.p1 TRINITY_DN27388_c0_g2~~TRINITY_DN27388_c0_g2_i1.p1  ORF type:complete len:422 (-),score=25.16 TRINITY_DN27388_c0_g2_i1:3-1223(-)